MTSQTLASKLEQLRAMTVVVADTGEVDEVRRLRPTDCTTNPTLLLKAAQNPAYADLVRDAVEWAKAQEGQGLDLTQAACDRLLIVFGRELTAIVPGRVSIEVDADLSFDAAGTVAKARALVAEFEAIGVARDRLLIKIAATWEGIEAARALQAGGIDCNLTLVFSMTQAIAAAQAGVFLISPFVGRVLDWHVARGEGPFGADTDPGVNLVRTIYGAYKSAGFTTVVMGASFRNVGEIEALAGCDRLTISPGLLDQLAADFGPLPRALNPGAPTALVQVANLDEADFRSQLQANPMAAEKLAEGVAGFVRDLASLRTLIGEKLNRSVG